jgi:hypothetical protein
MNLNLKNKLQNFETQLDFYRGKIVPQGIAKGIYSLWKEVGQQYAIQEERLNDNLSIVSIIKNHKYDCENIFFLVKGHIGKKLNMQ